MYNKSYSMKTYAVEYISKIFESVKFVLAQLLEILAEIVS